MDIGIPQEISIEEKRISLTPQGIYTLTKAGHNVYIEQAAGLGGHFYDANFQDVGGQIVYSHEEAFRRADLVVKLMPTTATESDLLKPDQIIFSFLQLSLRTPQSMQKLLANEVTAIGTELIETAIGHKPLLEAMSEIAGSMMPQIAGRFLECTHGGRGITISGAPGIPPATIIILGVGNVGISAASAFLGLGAQVFCLDDDIQKLRYVDTHFRKRVFTAVSNTYNIERALKFADVVIGAVFEHGKKTPIIIKKEHLSLMKQGSLIIDVAIDQGGCVETSRPTTHSDPIFIKEGIIHYCVPNILAAVARTASRALNNVVLPYILKIGEVGLKKAIDLNPELKEGIITFRGKSTNKDIAEMFDLPYQKFEI